MCTFSLLAVPGARTFPGRWYLGGRLPDFSVLPLRSVRQGVTDPAKSQNVSNDIRGDVGGVRGDCPEDLGNRK